MLSKKTINLIWWQLGIFLVVSFIAALTSMHFKDHYSKFVPETFINPSILNKKASGTSGLYELTKLIGLRSHLWKLPYRDLKDVRGQLVIIGPQQSLGKYEMETILLWVAKGNNLLYLDRFSSPYSREILAPLGMWTSSTAERKDVQAHPQADLTVAQFVGPTTVSYDNYLNPGNNMPILKYGNETILTEVRHGTGKVLICSAANLVANSRLTNSGANFQLVANWLRLNDSAVFFDERCHGLTQSRNLITSILSGSGGILFIQFVVIFGLAIGSSAQRFGQTLSVDSRRKISNLEFVNGIANSYQRAKATHLASDVLSHNLRLKLAKAMGQSTGDDEMLAAAYIDSLDTSEEKMALPDAKARLIKTLSHSKEGAKVNISYAELTEIIAYCDKIQESLDQKRKVK